MTDRKVKKCTVQWKNELNNILKMTCSLFLVYIGSDFWELGQKKILSHFQETKNYLILFPRKD